MQNVWRMKMRGFCEDFTELSYSFAAVVSVRERSLERFPCSSVLCTEVYTSAFEFVSIGMICSHHSTLFTTSLSPALSLFSCLSFASRSLGRANLHGSSHGFHSLGFACRLWRSGNNIVNDFSNCCANLLFYYIVIGVFFCSSLFRSPIFFSVFTLLIFFLYYSCLHVCSSLILLLVAR